MSSIIKNVNIERTRADSFPSIVTVPLFSVISLDISCSGNNSIESFSRIDAMKSICKYAESHNLKNTEDKSVINMDANLKSIFPNYVAQSEDLKYKKIMGGLGQHFPKKEK